MQVIFQRYYQNSKWPLEVNSEFCWLTNSKSQELFKFYNHIPPRYGDVQITFLRFCWNSKWPPRINFNFFGWSKNSKKLKAEIIQILQSHFPRYGDVQSIFLRFYWNSKWPPWMNFIIFCGRKNSKVEFINYSHFTITLPTIWKCSGDFTEI